MLDALHPGLRAELERMAARPDAKAFYAVPYSVAYADEMVRSHALLNEAADAVEKDDEEFARYLRNRARDLLSNDYESGDAAWVTGRFKNLNAQIGSYEIYDDELYGVKTFYSPQPAQQPARGDRASARGDEGLAGARGLSAVQVRSERVREDIPVGVYDVVADFAQSRGGNTATILPNEAYLGAPLWTHHHAARQHHAQPRNLSRAAAPPPGRRRVDPRHRAELTSDGNFFRTLWHEVGHYLGVDVTKDGRELDAALQDDADLLEEMKADLVSLYVAEALQEAGLLHRRAAPRGLRERHPARAPEQQAAPRPAVPDDAAHAVELLP